MNFQGRAAADEQFQLAPMIDIVFLLLIMFVAAYAAAQEERMLGVNLPAAETAKEQGRSAEDVVVDLNAKGEIFLYRKQRSPEYLENRLRSLVQFARDAHQEPGVIIRADGLCSHRYVVRLMDICGKAGVDRIMFSTISEGRGGEPDAE